MTFSDGLQCSRKQKAQDFSGYNIHLYPDIILTNTVAKRTSEIQEQTKQDDSCAQTTTLGDQQHVYRVDAARRPAQPFTRLGRRQWASASFQVCFPIFAKGRSLHLSY